MKLRQSPLLKSVVRSCKRHASFKDIKSNKSGLSWELDRTMRDGHHDMKTFGLGFLRSVSSVEQQAHTMASLQPAYAVLEHALDKSVESKEETRASKFWKKFSRDVRRATSLANDVVALGGNNLPIPAAARYVAAIQDAAENVDENNDISSKG